MQECFNIHGIGLAISTDSDEISKRLRQFLAGFPAQISASHVQGTFENAENPQPDNSAGPPILRYEDLSVSRADGATFYQDGFSTAELSRATSTFHARIHPRTLENKMFFENTFLAFLLWEALSLHNLFLLHAACLRAPTGASILLPALSRQGKSTTALTLIRAGFDYVSDDLVLLSAAGQIFDFPRDFHVDPALAKHFKELNFLTNQSPYFDLNPKRAITRKNIAQIYPGSSAVSQINKIDFVCIPQIKPIAQSLLTPIGKSAALAHCIPPSALVLVGDKTAATHLQALKKIVEGAQTFSLTLGEDIRQAPDKLLGLLPQLWKDLPHAATGI